MSKEKTRWGIVGAGRISSKFTNALSILPHEHQVSAVAAREKKRAEEFANRFNISKAYGSYEELSKDNNIEIVYIGTVTSTHYELCKLMMNAGKNVLCEKPLTVNLKQSKELTDLAKQRNVFFMEGLWSRFFPAYDQLRKELSDKTLGIVKFVNVNFGLPLYPHDKRIFDLNIGGSVLLDLGVYAVQFATLVYEGATPERIVSSVNLLENGCDLSSCVTLYYSGGRLAQMNIHGDCLLPNNAVVCGTRGILELPERFWNPSILVTSSQKYDFPIPVTPRDDEMPRSGGFIYQIQAVRQCLLKGLKECSLVSHQETLTIIDILDKIRKQIGVHYDVD